MQHRLITTLLGLSLWLGLAAPLHAAEPPVERLQITDPFVDLHTGPGRGYPKFHVAERSEWIEIEQRRTDWYRVRTASGQVGWVHRTQLASTLTASGERKRFFDVAVDDYLRRRLELGASLGRFEKEPMLKLWASYRLADTLAIEGSLGQVQGLYSGTDYWQVNLTSEPWSDRRWSPYFGIGVGRFDNLPNLSLVNAVPTNANLANAAIGLRYYLSDRFVVRVDYTLYTAFLADERYGEYRAFTAGLSFFF